MSIESVNLQKYRELFEKWFRPLEPVDGFTEEEIVAVENAINLKLPRTLRDLYKLAGKCREITETQNFLLVPNQVRVEGDFLQFYLENQNCHIWGVMVSQVADDDPPVFIDCDERASTTLTDFLLGMLIVEIVLGSNGLQGSGRVSSSSVTTIQSQYENFGFQLRMLTATETVFFQDPDTLMFLHLYEWDENEGDIFVIARTEQAIVKAGDIQGIIWEGIDISSGH